jgi:hypothetical protein
MRGDGEDLASVAFAASVLVVLVGYAAWLPFANGVDSPVRVSGILLWVFSILSAVGAVSLLRGWHPGIRIAAGIAIASLVSAILGATYLTGILVVGQAAHRGFSSEYPFGEALVPVLVAAVMSGVAAWRIAKILGGKRA